MDPAQTNIACPPAPQYVPQQGSTSAAATQRPSMAECEPGLVSAAMRLDEACQTALARLSSAISAEQMDAYTDDKSLVGWWMSNNSWDANMAAANAVTAVEHNAMEVNRYIMQQGTTAHALAPIACHARGEAIAEAEQSEHTVGNRMIDWFTNTNIQDTCSSMNTLSVLRQCESQVRQVSYQAQALVRQLHAPRWG